MDEEVAARISSLMLGVGARLDASVEVRRSGCNEAEFVAYRRAIASIMGTMLTEVTNPICSQFPYWQRLRPHR